MCVWGGGYTYNEEQSVGLRGRGDDMIWRHFGKGHSGCSERRETVGRQDWQAQTKCMALAASQESKDASLHHGDSNEGGEAWSDSWYN